jgi:putative hydrolase of the HAD superfamily
MKSRDNEMIKAVFFDLYHTLIGYDPPREETLSASLAACGQRIDYKSLRRPLVAADEYYYRETIRKPLKDRDKDETLSIWHDYYSVALNEAGIVPTSSIIDHLIDDMQKTRYELTLFGDVKPALAELSSRGLGLGVISNADRDISPLLEKLGVLSHLTVRLTSSQAGAAKPDPGIFRKAAGLMGVEPYQSLYVGDQWAVDVQGARGAGMQALLLDRGCFFEEIQPSDKINSLVELSDRIQNL